MTFTLPHQQTIIETIFADFFQSWCRAGLGFYSRFRLFWASVERFILGQCGGDFFWDSVAEMLLTSVQCVSGLRENWHILEPS